MKLHCTIPLLVSFKSVLLHPTPSLGIQSLSVQGGTYWLLFAMGGGVQDLWGEQMHLPDSAGFRHLSSLSHHTPQARSISNYS